MGIERDKVKVWYYSPFPPDYFCDTLYVCDICLTFYTERQQMQEHGKRCRQSGPPGDEIYRDGEIAMFELDGKLQRTYCENLCLVSKLFLDHKTLRYDCEPFHFYVLTERKKNSSGEYKYHFCGYFSKEKGWNIENNLSCILVMPYCQRKGYGKFLIAFSYELSILEGRIGTPERPLSDLGFRSYISWWAHKIITFLLSVGKAASALSLSEIAEKTAIEQNDVLYVLENFKILRKVHNQQILFTHKDYLEEILKHLGSSGREVRRDRIRWIPNLLKPEK